MPKELPEGFELQLHKFCKGCIFFDVVSESFFEYGTPYLTIITCRNYNQCEHIQKQIKKENAQCPLTETP